jgi:HD-GYP domain-containing protein (c-di-GMP phosphodiesterase class II)
MDGLKELSLFSGISDGDLRRIAQSFCVKEYREKETIIREKGEADAFFIIRSGRVIITKLLDDGEEVTLGVHGRGDFFGELSLLDSEPRSATVKAAEPTTLLAMNRKNFETLLLENPRIAFTVMREMGHRLRTTGDLLVSDLRKKNRQLTQAYVDTINAMVNALEARDPYTHGHTKRVTLLSKAIGRELGIQDKGLLLLELGALLHDVGKIGIPDSILHKEGPLEEAEYRRVQEHPWKGEKILKNISYLEQAIPLVLHHHKHFDGKGYPGGIADAEISLSARILAVADAFDAMTSDRPYRNRMSLDQAVQEVKSCAGKQFDPQVVEAFLRVLERGEIQQNIQKQKE